ncbi:MAG: TetR/AcrR family transcriptional regulator [Myxococcota bacterium]
MAAKGYAGVGLREIAAAVGLGKSSLFHHFPTKLDLYGAVLEQVLTRLALDLDLQTRPEDGPAERSSRDGSTRSCGGWPRTRRRRG